MPVSPRAATLPLRYAIVVSHRRNFASRFVEHAVARDSSKAQLVAVVLHGGTQSDRKRRGRGFLRKVDKARRIGLIGTLNGFRMRRWYNRDVTEQMGNRDLLEVCAEHGVPLIQIPSFRDPEAQAALRGMELDLAVSMGNGYVTSRFFSIPRFGTINVHHELLPEYRGAQTCLWQIHDGSAVSGYSIHEMTTTIDGGRVLHREPIATAFASTLHRTIVDTAVRVQLASIEGLLYTLNNFRELRETAAASGDGGSYTTPSTRALLRIYRNFFRMSRAKPSASVG